MVTREDLKVVSTSSFFEGHTRDIVSYNDKTYIVAHHKVPANPDTQPETFSKWLSTLDGDYAILFMFDLIPLEETFVMEAEWDELEQGWFAKNECGPQCETGVCNKRIASNTKTGSQDLAYNMLVDHLNA